ncbi:MAG: hypothetical protein ACI825_000877 [Planctomycetota bacterium]|jgi:hypothetical protein|uniref:hypothetical protein n=1 Tax=Patiriisocius sp. Uisw_047 TaxID=3230969 RepID=UPI0039EB876D
MTTDSNPTKFKVFIGLLIVLLFALGAYTYHLFSENQDSKNSITTLETEKKDMEAELEELIANYDVVIESNEFKDKELVAAKERIEVLLADVKNAKLNEGLLKRYRAEIQILKQERVVLFKRADSLARENITLQVQIDSTNVRLTDTYKVVDSMSTRNSMLSETVKMGALVKATNLKSEGVIVRSSGKIVETQRASRADKIRACFTLAPNDIAEAGDKVLYVQVINPENNILGHKANITNGDGLLTYSSTVKVFYEKGALDVCSLIDASEDDLVKGRYVINVFEGTRLLLTNTLELK